MQEEMKTIRGALELLPDGDVDGWWCPECQDTYNCASSNECCLGCGTYLADCQPTNETADKKAKAKTALEAMIKGE